ncbi:hypothetical protein ACLMJK_008776 [Lecanora helva]
MARLKRSPAQQTLRDFANTPFTSADSGRRQISPPPTSSLPSNNPFRNRAVSPANSLPSPMGNSFGNFPSTTAERPTSRNPFLDHSEKKNQASVSVRATSPEKGESGMSGRMSPTKPALTGHAVELFDNLTLNESSSANGQPPQGMPPPYSSRPPRAETMPVRSENLPPRARHDLSGHHPSRSHEEGNHRPRDGMKPRRNELDVFADPPSPEQRRDRARLRRNSDSSINSRVMDPEAEQRRRERHRREREARHKDGKGKPPTSSRSKRPNKQLDIIDSLDVSSIFGTGVFHHDGPFDACNAHRNRKGLQRAPMQAFAKDSANNSMGGSGPVNKDINFAQFHGRGEEGFTDYSASGNRRSEESFKPEAYAGPNVPSQTRRPAPGVTGGVIDRASSFNPHTQVEKIYGAESMGLGATTHLEGAPAPRTIRRDSDNEKAPGANNAGGLGRKRSLAQKIRGINSANRGRELAPSGRITSPEGTYERKGTPTGAGEAQSGGGMPKIRETNPFFSDYNDAYDRKGRMIQDAQQRDRSNSIGQGEEQLNVRSRATSSPKRNIGPGMLERRITNDGPASGSGESSGGGGGGGSFLNRVKSLKGGKRTRPERRE